MSISQAQTVTMAASPTWLNFSALGNSEMMLNLQASVATDWVMDAANASAAGDEKTAGRYFRTYAAAANVTVSANPSRLWALGTSATLASAVRIGG